MSYETVVAAFDTHAHAEAAVKALRTGGFADADISVLDKHYFPPGDGAKIGAKEPGFWHRLFGANVHEHEATVYGRTVEQGGTVVSARVLDNEVAHATAILDLHHPIDVHDRAITSGVAPASRVDTIERAIKAEPLAMTQKVAVPEKIAEKHGEVLQLAEEQLAVGKEMIESGRTRVRRYVTERDVSADVTLHDEHAEILRRAVTEPKFVGDVDWADAEIEVVETAEHALANKTARIVEEVSLKKIGSDHVETIKDKLRRQQVKVERIGTDGKVLRD